MQKFVSIGATHILGLTLALTSVGASAQTDADAQPESNRNFVTRHPVRTVIGAGAVFAGAVVLHRTIKGSVTEPVIAPEIETYGYRPDMTPKERTPEAVARDLDAETRAGLIVEAPIATELAPQTPVDFPVDDVIADVESPIGDAGGVMTPEEVQFHVGGETAHSVSAAQLGLPSALGFIEQDSYILKAGTDVPVKVVNPETNKEYAVVVNPNQKDSLLLIRISSSLNHDSRLPHFTENIPFKSLTAERLAELDPSSIIEAARAKSAAFEASVAN